jgi:hypothetical protein
MSYYKNNEISLYLRPIDYQPNYQINNCAEWLVKKSYAKNKIHAYNFLNHLAQNNKWRYKSIMSAYYADVDYKYKDYSFNDVNNYRTSKLTENPYYSRYGEYHMYQY